MDVCIYTTYQIKKCVYIIKKTFVFMCVYGVVLINILVLQLGPPKQKFLAPPLGGVHTTSLDPLPGSRCYLANPRKFLCFRLPAGLRASLMVQNTLHNREWEQKKGDSNSFYIHQIFFLLMNVTHQVWWATIHSSNLFFLL